MTNHFSMLNSFIKRHVEISEAELTTFNQKCEIVEFSKGELISNSCIFISTIFQTGKPKTVF